MAITQSVLEVPGLVDSIVFQPMPTLIAQKSRDMGAYVRSG